MFNLLAWQTCISPPYTVYTQRLVIQSYISQFTMHGFQYQHYQSLYIKNELLWGHWSNGCRDIIFLWHVLKQQPWPLHNFESTNKPHAFSELHHGLEGLGVRQSHHPEQLRPPTALMEIHLDGLLFFLKHLQKKKCTLIKYCQMSIEMNS